MQHFLGILIWVQAKMIGIYLYVVQRFLIFYLHLKTQ